MSKMPKLQNSTMNALSWIVDSYIKWLSKDARRIEIIDVQYEVDEIEQQNAKTAELDYEASFPGT